QGAEAINKSVMEMLPQLRGMKNSVRILHQTGQRQVEEVKTAYKQFDIQAEISPFIVAMADAYADADLIICRAGATSLAEITAAGKAAVLIPYPWAANDHQTKNAQALEAEGAAAVIPERELSGAKLFSVVENLLRDEKKLRQMEENSLRISKVDAAETIVDACIKLMAEKNGYH
ncbi:MAG: UDP-N-acetylglucosamine--N-acetylmuramyl-(pentapeptide) pyrophosphoryl-undecaprenol N-acetylglucosamine transferase, partial [Syntrophaceae bacterium]|nr:UDP-N-acetylglucosamine--N-acetylmuramyl-(pentapeptide) pyrophosphoryl-undecaprenol N-acetylglucosamine transferase [Syntrophaceae bacterium]